jgi:hypothetical protein
MPMSQKSVESHVSSLIGFVPNPAKSGFGNFDQCEEFQNPSQSLSQVKSCHFEWQKRYINLEQKKTDRAIGSRWKLFVE